MLARLDCTSFRHGVGVLHYDRDYDTPAARTDIRFASVWLARRDSL